MVESVYKHMEWWKEKRRRKHEIDNERKSQKLGLRLRRSIELRSLSTGDAERHL